MEVRAIALAILFPAAETQRVCCMLHAITVQAAKKPPGIAGRLHGL